MTGTSFDGARTTAMVIDAGYWRLTMLEGIDFTKARLKDISFAEADLRECCFNSAVLTRCDFTGADIRGASFKNADLRTSRLANVSLLDADFKGAKVDLEQAVLFAEALGVKVIL